MGLNIVVLAKQVPDTRHITGEAMKADGTINREALPVIFNPEDLYALEAALLIKDAFPGTVLRVISMGPPGAATVLKDCLYRGADFTALVSDRGFAGADTQATSYALKCAIEKAGAYDLIFCGRQAIDGDTAQTGPMTAEKLGINQITCVSRIEKIDADKREIIALRSIEGGWEKVRSGLPVLLSFTNEGEPPRPASAKRLMAHKHAAPAPDDPVMALWDIPAIKADPGRCGFAGSSTVVKDVSTVVLSAGEIKYVDPGEEGISELIRDLIADHTLG
jgi:electron transfer flavoprotein beta subunit